MRCRSQPLTAPANDVTFLAEGAFAYLAGGDPAGITVKRTCDNGQADKVTVPGSPVPTFLKTLPGQASLLNADPKNHPDPPDAFHIISLAPPLISIISAHPPAQAFWTGCTPTVVNDDPIPVSFDLGRGNFVASQLILSQDGSTAYIVTPNFNSILVFNIGAQTSSAIPLAGNGIPLARFADPRWHATLCGKQRRDTPRSANRHRHGRAANHLPARFVPKFRRPAFPWSELQSRFVAVKP